MTTRILIIALVCTVCIRCSYGGPSNSASSGISADKNAKNSENRIQKEQLYEAYNLLHTLAQDFKKPFDAPAVLVVGHQTSGKSALIEALMGFQFNQVGGGTKTRRPVALKMQYNPTCTSPVCFLTLENGKEESRSLEDIQAYIEAENKRLERDPSRCFDPREIHIRMEYKYCPNMIVIDTPGMIHAPKGRQLTPQQRALVQASREAEALVFSKIKCQDYIILCVEDTTDWKHATTRNIVTQADPDLSRTVLVTTKLDTKLPQFSEKEDLEEFLDPGIIKRMFPRILGGPFFTSVPSGRVGVTKDFSSNEAFVRALLQAERADRNSITGKVGVPNVNNAMINVGITKLRSFLEARVDDSYRRNVAKIVPMLQTELRAAQNKLESIEEELSALSIDRLRIAANTYRELFSRYLSEVIHGSVRVNPEEWGESIGNEQLNGGSFLEPEQLQSEVWQRLLEYEVGNGKHKLYGGAQYHRAIREFAVAVRHMSTAVVSENEIANAAGMGDIHDGVNFMRAACVIAMEKAQSSFEPMLEALRYRTTHIMRRLFPIIEVMMSKGPSPLPPETHTRPFQEMIRKIYDKFVRLQIEECLSKCKDDLRGMTRFVTWDVDGKGGSSALYRSLPTPKKIAEIYSIAVDNKSTKQISNSNTAPKTVKTSKEEQYKEWKKQKEDRERTNGKNKQKSKDSPASKTVEALLADDDDDDIEDETALVPANQKRGVALSGGWKADEQAQVSDYYDFLQLMEEMLAGNNANRTSTVVTALVQLIIRTWRDHFARTVAMKFNCFFLMPFLDDFPAFLRNELDAAYASGLTEMFDITEARISLQERRRQLIAECDANSKLQRRFDLINSQLRNAAREESDSSEDDLNSSSSWQDESSSFDGDEQPIKLRGESGRLEPSFSGGIPRPVVKDNEARKTSDRRRRYPGVEDLDMENL